MEEINNGVRISRRSVGKKVRLRVNKISGRSKRAYRALLTNGEREETQYKIVTAIF